MSKAVFKSLILFFHHVPQSMFHGLVVFLVFQLLLVAGASALSLTIPTVVTFGQPFTAFYTRTETDPRKFNLNVLENGVPFIGPFHTGFSDLSGNFTVPGLIPVGIYLAQASDDDDGHILATSNEIQIEPPGGSNPGTTISSRGATTTANRNQGTPASVAETTNNPTSSPRSQTQSTTSSSSAVSIPATSLSASSTDSHIISRSSQTSTTTTSSLAEPTLGSPSSSARVNQLPIIIGACATVLVLVMCVLLALWLLRGRRQREEQFEPAPTLFVLNPESYTIQTHQRSSGLDQGLRKSRAPRSSTYNSPIESGTASAKFSDRRSRASRAVSSSDSSDQTLTSPSSGPGDLTDRDLLVPEASSQSGSVISSATLPVAFVVAEYQRLRLENQILRRGDMPESGLIYGDSLPPSYPGSSRASMYGMPMPLDTI
ncbi:hypothetical protein C8J56DRAFT_960963 [Mycena floridula]|nr:hypothetical protein C8J56DRAFT_960963 [Mycena floridula]